MSACELSDPLPPRGKPGAVEEAFGYMDRLLLNTAKRGSLYRANSEGMNQCHPGLPGEIGPHGFCTRLRPPDNGNRSLLDRWLDSSLGIGLAEIDRPSNFYGCKSLSS